MAFFGPFWAFFFYFLGDATAGIWAARRYIHGKEAGHCRLWQFSRVLVSACSFLAGWDCLRIFAGGFWDPNATEAPLFAYSIYPLMMVHLVLVPLLMIPNTDIEYASRVQKSIQDGTPKTDETDIERYWRIAVGIVAVILSLMGFHTWFQKVQATLDPSMGLWKGQEFGGITTWKLREHHDVESLGLWIIPEEYELAGIFAFAGYSVVIGAVMLYNVGHWQYFVLQFICLAGQGVAGAVLQDSENPENDMFSYGSNVMEAVSFLAMVYADSVFWELPGKTPLNDELAIVELS